MRLFYTLIITSFVVFANIASAQNITVLHHNGLASAFYGTNSFASAYASSLTGDTIYLSGGFFNSPTYIDKGIHIYGAGHYPDSTDATYKTIIINGGITFEDNADNVWIEGIEVSGITTTTDVSINNITLRRNHITGNLTFQGSINPCLSAIIVQNVIDGSIYGSNAQLLLLSNNIIVGKIFNMEANMIHNNLLLSTSYMGWPYYNYLSMVNINNCSINNNIFLNEVEPSVLSGTGNTIYNNVFSVAYIPGSNITSGNYLSVVPSAIFVSQSGNIFDYSYNYHLQSPAIYIGTDGLQCGIYGGNYPYKEGAVPSNPHIISKNISSTTLPNGDLNININVSAQDE